jgi:hypothetical protein
MKRRDDTKSAGEREGDETEGRPGVVPEPGPPTEPRTFAFVRWRLAPGSSVSAPHIALRYQPPRPPST